MYLLRESRAVDVETGGLDADLSPRPYTITVSPDKKLEDLGITKWDLRQLIIALTQELKRTIYLDVDAVFDDEHDLTVAQLVDAIYLASCN